MLDANARPTLHIWLDFPAGPTEWRLVLDDDDFLHGRIYQHRAKQTFSEVRWARVRPPPPDDPNQPIPGLESSSGSEDDG